MSPRGPSGPKVRADWQVELLLHEGWDVVLMLDEPLAALSTVDALLGIGFVIYASVSFVLLANEPGLATVLLLTLTALVSLAVLGLVPRRPRADVRVLRVRREGITLGRRSWAAHRIRRGRWDGPHRGGRPGSRALWLELNDGTTEMLFWTDGPVDPEAERQLLAILESLEDRGAPEEIPVALARLREPS